MNRHALQFDEVSYRYPGGREALRKVSFRIAPGEKVALAGANGAGKSTLLLHTDGLLLPTAGRIVVDGIALSPRTLPQIRRSVGLVFQHPDDQLFMPTVEEDVAFGPTNLRLTPEEIESRVARALEAVGGTALRREAPHRLSGGQKRCVAIAGVLAMEPSILVLDEPTAELDPRARRRIIELLRQLRRTMLVATHDLELAAALCPRTLILKEGELAADGATRTLFADDALLAACGLERPHALRPNRAGAGRPAPAEARVAAPPPNFAADFTGLSGKIATFAANKNNRDMEFEGTVYKIMPVTKGTSARGEWQRQDVVFEMQDGAYTRKICVTFFNRPDDVARLREGATYNVSVNIESREYNGRWYTDIRAWRLQPRQQEAPAAAPMPDLPPIAEEPTYAAAPAAEVDDLPF